MLNAKSLYKGVIVLVLRHSCEVLKENLSTKKSYKTNENLDYENSKLQFRKRLLGVPLNK